MPRSKGYKRSLASRIMMAERRALTPMPPVSEFVARRGTGCRHRVRRWPTSYLTGRQVKFIPPTFDPEKKTVFVIGDSHLRGLVDGDVAIPEVPLSLSFLSVPGGVAPDLKTELQRLQFPWTPDVVCVLAPSNYLDRGTICDAAVEFGALLTSVRSRWAKVFVLDFPPRLNKPVGLQDLLRQEYHGVAARMGLPFVAVTSGFLLDRLELWCSDGVHLSDTGGSPILVELLCDAALTQFAHDPPAPPSPPRTSPPARVTGPDPLPRRRQDPRRWTRVGQEGKEDQTKPEDKASDSSESSIKESDSSLPPASDWVVPMETDSPPKATSPIQSSESLTSDSSAPSSRSSPSSPSSPMDIKADAKQEAKCNLETKKSLLKEEKNDVIFVKVDTEKEKVEVEQTSKPSRPSSTPPSNTSSHESNSSSGLKRTLSEGFDNDGQAVKREGKRPKVERGELEAELELKITAKAGSHHELEKIVQQLVEERLRVIEMSIYEKNFQELKGRVDKIDCATKHQTAIHTLQAKIARLSKKFGEVNQASENKRKQEALAAAASAKASLATTPQITRGLPWQTIVPRPQGPQKELPPSGGKTPVRFDEKKKKEGPKKKKEKEVTCVKSLAGHMSEYSEGKCKADIKLRSIPDALEKVLYQNSKRAPDGHRPERYASYIFRYLVPYDVYCGWVKRVNYTGAMGKEALPNDLRRSLRTHVERWFPILSANSWREIRDVVNELLRVKRKPVCFQKHHKKVFVFLPGLC